MRGADVIVVGAGLPAEDLPRAQPSSDLDFETGLLVGVLLGEGHFGGDGRVPQVTLRMHVRHEQLFRWIVARFGGKLYGPYHHAGRHYYQWMARGRHLRQVLVPILDAGLSAGLDLPSWSRYQEMKRRYRL
jgi:hypothetical protein